MAATTTEAAEPKSTAGAPNPISREVVKIYNELVESGRWDTDYTTKPVEFRGTLLTLRKILTGGGLESILNPTRENLLIRADLYNPLAVLTASTSSNSSRKTLKRSHKSSSRKQTYKHSKKE